MRSEGEGEGLGDKPENKELGISLKVSRELAWDLGPISTSPSTPRAHWVVSRVLEYLA